MWYKAVGDANHESTEPASVAATIDPTDKAALNKAIMEAEAYYDSIKGDALYADIAATLKQAIDAAKAVAGNDNALESDISAQVSTVSAAIDATRSAAEAAKQAADAAAAKAVEESIEQLPASAGLSDKEKVAAARAAYEKLSADQKALVPADVVSKLTAAEQQVKAAEEQGDRTVDIGECSVSVKDQTFTGKALKPAVTVKHGDVTLVQGADYALKYENNKNAGTAKVTVSGMGKYVGTKVATFKIAKANIAKCKLTVKDQTYTGKKLSPKVTVKFGKTKLKKGTSYTVTCKNNRKIGKATVIVKGKGNFTGTAKATFKINPRPTAITSLSTAGKAITVQWEKQKDVTGFEIEYSRSKDFKKSKTIKVKNEKGKTVNADITGLKAGKKYYVRVRTYKVVKKKAYYSEWSKAKTIKVSK